MMDYRRIALNPVANLYERLGINPESTTCAQDVLDIDASLGQIGINQDDTPRRELAVAWKVIHEPHYRHLYDTKMLGKPVTWDDIAHLATYGTVPASALFIDNPVMTPHDAPHQQQPLYQEQPYGTTATARPAGSPSPGFSPFIASTMGAVKGYTTDLAAQYSYAPPVNPQIARRADYKTRFWLAIADLAIYSTLVGPTFAFWSHGHYIVGVLSQVLAVVCYFVLTEAYIGGTPAKFIWGYRVQNAMTGENLTITESLKRNWWRMISVVPGVGNIISFLAAIAYYRSLKRSEFKIAEHDRIVHAEVVKKDM